MITLKLNMIKTQGYYSQTESDSSMYEIKTEVVYKDFSDNKTNV